MKIGHLSDATATPIETIRYYERERLLPAPARTLGNFRIYEARHIDRLVFIRHCRSLDMSLDEIRRLLHFKDAGSGDCANVDALLDEHIEHVARRIKELRLLEKQLKALRERCDAGRPAGECGILAGLSVAAEEPAVPTHGHARLKNVHGP